MPIYAHVKDVIDPQGKLEAIEVNYMTFLAFNGSYKVNFIPLGKHAPLDLWSGFTLGRDTVIKETLKANSYMQKPVGCEQLVAAGNIHIGTQWASSTQQLVADSCRQLTGTELLLHMRD